MANAPEETARCALDVFKRRLAAGRAEIAALHRTGRSGRRVCSALCELTDALVTCAYRERLERTRSADRPALLAKLALAAVGGYGRGDLAPFSDVDLLFLVDPREEACIRGFISALVRDLWDSGLKLSHSVRSPADCVSAARQDISTRTALGEARLLAGHSPLFADMHRRVHGFITSSALDRFLTEALTERGREHEDYYAATVCLLEPNVKKSPGGLRDLHMLRWVALARYGTAEPEMLRLGGLLSPDDTAVLADTSEYLLRLRHELHFHAGRQQDVLTRGEQLRLSEWLNYRDEGGLLAVERFMRHYYRRTAGLHDLVMRFLDGARRRSLLVRVADRLWRRRHGHLRLRHDRIEVEPAARTQVLNSPLHVLALFDAARRHGRPIAHEVLEAIRAHVPDWSIQADVRRQFLSLLVDPVRLGSLLRGLHRIGLLSRLVPAFEHARGLIQFNLAHRYTVDQHTLLAVECAAARAADRGPVGEAYRGIHRKDLLHLALLCHDLGKGLGEDHCAAGRRIAEEVADQFGLAPRDRGLFIWLVHQHLLMAQTAFRRDIGDEQTLLQFTRAAGTPEALRMLYVMTAADTEAVAPGNWTAWKESLLTELYARALDELSGEAPLTGREPAIEQIRRDLIDGLHIHFPLKWLESQLALMSSSYLRRTDPDRIAADLRMLQRLVPGGVEVDGEFLPDLNLSRFTVVARDDLVPGIFSRIAAVLAAEQVEVLHAQIITRSDGILIDTFQGQDTTFTGRPPAGRLQEISGTIADTLLGRRPLESLTCKLRIPAVCPAPARVMPAQVEIDNDSSDRCTIIEVFADDHPGLLYSITRTLFELGLSVKSARISTHSDQVVDVFYVTLQDGRKVSDEAAHDVIRARLLVVVNS